jgi:hypothetical protein
MKHWSEHHDFANDGQYSAFYANLLISQITQICYV